MPDLAAMTAKFLERCPCEGQLDGGKPPWVRKRDQRGEFITCPLCGRFYGRIVAARAVRQTFTGGEEPADNHG